ncbi:hypothetical protein GCM10027440_20490 [Nocardiopsis coralliicola]
MDGLAAGPGARVEAVQSRVGVCQPGVDRLGDLGEADPGHSLLGAVRVLLSHCTLLQSSASLRWPWGSAPAALHCAGPRGRLGTAGPARSAGGVHQIWAFYIADNNFYNSEEQGGTGNTRGLRWRNSASVLQNP